MNLSSHIWSWCGISPRPLFCSTNAWSDITLQVCIGYIVHNRGYSNDPLIRMKSRQPVYLHYTLSESARPFYNADPGCLNPLHLYQRNVTILKGNLHGLKQPLSICESHGKYGQLHPKAHQSKRESTHVHTGMWTPARVHKQAVTNMEVQVCFGV